MQSLSEDHVASLAGAPAVRLGSLVIEPALRRVTRDDDGREAVLEPRVMQVLVALAQAQGRVLTRERLLSSCWPGVIVGDDALNRVIGRIRRLSETLGAGVVRLETITKVGYRLVQTSRAFDPSVSEPRGRPGAERLGNLPRRLTPLIGRKAELEAIAAQLQSADLVTVTGAGGVGKTRLALEAGQSLTSAFEDGVWLAELAATTEPEQVPGTVARAMSIDLPVGEDAAEALVERVKRRRCLIILDNCEHLIDAAAALAEAIVGQSSTVKLIATSQELLRVEGEQVFSLRSLSEADAARLFAERARAADAGFDLARQSADAVAAICRRLDGIPLAIEMAAARAPQLGCEGLLRRLDDRFRLLTGGRRTALPRQRTLHAALDWSHELLSERDAAVFRRLGVFAGGFTLEAASEVAADQRIDALEVAGAVGSLVAKSLVSPEALEARPRYRMLETARAYALEKLAAAGEVRALEQAHADHFLDLAARAREAFLLGPVSDEAFAERYAAEAENVTRALEWAFGPDGDAELGIALAAESHPILARGAAESAEHDRWAEIALSRLGAATPPNVRARLLSERAGTLVFASPARALDLADEAIEACRAHGDEHDLSQALRARAMGYANLGRFEAGEVPMREAVEIAAAFPPSRAKALIMQSAWYVARPTDPTNVARALLDAAIAQAEPIGAEGVVTFCQMWALTQYGDQEAPDSAIGAWRDLIARVRPAHAWSDFAVNRATCILTTHLMKRNQPGDLEEALALCRPISRTVSPGHLPRFLIALAWIPLRFGRSRDAAKVAGAAEPMLAGLEERSEMRGYFSDLYDALAAELSEHALTGLLREGATLTRDQAVQLALEG